jgi:tripartite tricarboxylate transporter family receptor
LHLIAGAVALPTASRVASAQAYPSRPVHLIVGFPASGLTDILARLLGSSLSERLGQQFIVEDRPGAGTNLATEAVVRALPDGYTLLMASSSNAIDATLYDNLKFNFIRDPRRSLPDIADHIVDAVAARLKGGHGRGPLKTILVEILDWKIPLPGVGHVFAAGCERIAPGEFLTVKPAARSELPFGFGRKILAGPLRTSIGSSSSAVLEAI